MARGDDGGVRAKGGEDFEVTCLFCGGVTDNRSGLCDDCFEKIGHRHGVPTPGSHDPEVWEVLGEVDGEIPSKFQRRHRV